MSGSCCVEYRPCAGVPLAFALQNVAVVSAKNDNDCNEDYVGIEGASDDDCLVFFALTGSNQGSQLVHRIAGMQMSCSEFVIT